MNTYNYEINEDGSIISKHTGKQIYVARCRKGYNRVRLKHSDGGKSYLVHRLIAIKFIPNPDNLPQVNHKDGNKNNNHIDNLEWVTNKQNSDHARTTGLYPKGSRRPNAKFTDDMVREVRSKRLNGATYFILGDEYKCSFQTIEKICKRSTYIYVE